MVLIRSLGSKGKSGHQTGSYRTEQVKNPNVSVVAPARGDPVVFAVLIVFSVCGTHFLI